MRDHQIFWITGYHLLTQYATMLLLLQFYSSVLNKLKFFFKRSTVSFRNCNSIHQRLHPVLSPCLKRKCKFIYCLNYPPSLAAESCSLVTYSSASQSFVPWAEALWKDFLSQQLGNSCIITKVINCRSIQSGLNIECTIIFILTINFNGPIFIFKPFSKNTHRSFFLFLLFLNVCHYFECINIGPDLVSSLVHAKSAQTWE